MDVKTKWQKTKTDKNKHTTWCSTISEHASAMFIRISTCSPSLCFLGPSRWLRGVLFHGLEIGKFHRLVQKSGKNATIYQAYFIHAGTGTLSLYKPVKKTLEYIILHVCDEWRRHFKNLQVELRKHWSMIQTVKNILLSVIQRKQTGQTLWIRLQAPKKTHL